MDFLEAIEKAKSGLLVRPKGYCGMAIKWEDESKRFKVLYYSITDGALCEEFLGEADHDRGVLKADDILSLWETTTLGVVEKEYKSNLELIACV